MAVDVSKIDLGNGILGLLVSSMTGHSSLKFVPEDEGVVGISTRISPNSKKLLEQLSEVGNVSQSIITRICIENGLNQISRLLVEYSTALEEAEAALAAEYEAEENYDEEAANAEVINTLAELRKRKASKK